MKATVIQIIDEVAGIKSFRLKPEEIMEYLPGKWMYVIIKQNLRHHFTISSSPSEDFLQFTTKFSDSEYKKTLWGVKPGEEIEIRGPFGSFFLDEKDTAPKLFVAGGIGITPFRSIFRYIADKKLKIPVTLLYSGKNKEEMAFFEELAAVKVQNSMYNVQLIETEKSGRLDEKMIRQLIPDYMDKTWWICGPPAMVEGMMDIAVKMNVPAGKIKSEEFTGY
ncbi:hypothetical protein A2395_00685 [Candidatus Amesbacteria bacterium RIFOXYB1_FULL_47_9]|uniref:FAD-binding FR-type domain-containing protein n=2 Tax=Candidatus Amesiibacteriota TaxID=1752730 RepID=A0A1F4ZYG7_9BACT|nr:MAG: hypothetical protein A2395_00685 [Candidatus Amesbacteria bacterium RIFOXYB1_FULL_47_9]